MAASCRPVQSFVSTTIRVAARHSVFSSVRRLSLATRSPSLSSSRHYASKKTLERKAAKPKHQSSSAVPSHTPPQKRTNPISTPQYSAPAQQPLNLNKLPYLPSTIAYIRTLASRTTPTLLYSSPQSNSLPITTTTVSTFCFAYGAYHLYTNFVLPQPDGLWWGIPYAMGGVSILMLALGYWVRGSGRALVGRIEALPLHIAVSGATAHKSSLPRSAVDQNIVLCITQKTVFPNWARFGRPPRTVVAMPFACRLSSRMTEAQAESADSPAHDRNITVQGQRVRVSAREYAAIEEEQKTQAKGPAAVVGGMVSRGLAGFGRIVTRDGLVPLDILASLPAGRRPGSKDAGMPGKRLRMKLDVSQGAYIGEGGLERLLEVK